MQHPPGILPVDLHTKPGKRKVIITYTSAFKASHPTRQQSWQQSWLLSMQTATLKSRNENSPCVFLKCTLLILL